MKLLFVKNVKTATNLKQKKNEVIGCKIALGIQIGIIENRNTETAENLKKIRNKINNWKQLKFKTNS